MHISYLHNCYRWQSLTCLQSEASKSLALQKEKSRTKTQQLVDFLRNTARWRSTQSWLETSEMLSIQVILSCPCVGWVEPLLNFDTKRDFWDLAGSPSNPPTNPMNESMIKTMTIIMTTSKVRNLNVRAASFFYSPVFCDTGRTKSVDWRKEQLRAVDRFETQFSQLSASWTNQDAGWEWGRLHLSVEDRPEQTTPGDNHGRNRLLEVSTQEIFCQYIHIWCPSCQEWHYWSSTRNWRLDPRHVRTHFQPFLIILSFSFQFWNPP